MLLYYLLLPFLYLFSRLPSALLYRISDVIAFTLLYIVRYRKEVVYANLRNSFPDQTAKEIDRIAKQSYTHLADRVVESIKSVTVSKDEIQQRVITENMELLNGYYKKGRHVVLMVGHIASWEFAGYKLSINSRFWNFAIVSRVSNRYFNTLVQSTRGKLGMHLVTMKDAQLFFKKELRQLSVGAFISDQSPPTPSRAYWTNFLHQDTPFFTGAERYARHHNCVVIYPKIVQTSRGHYKARLHLITENPQAEPENGITEKFVRLLENQIRENPSDWLWSHKRWKHKRK